ncbi:MAG: hypothetical protein ACLQU2_08485 [Candidatus Binataceae bacterium]
MALHSRAYRIDFQEFSAFAGLSGLAALRTVARAHVINLLSL